MGEMLEKVGHMVQGWKSKNLNMAGIGGISRKEGGDFVACYSKHIFKNTNNVAKVWAIRKVFVWLWSLGLLIWRWRVTQMTQSNCAKEVLSRKGSSQPQWEIKRLGGEINNLKGQFNQVKFSHRCGEANNVANKLAKVGAFKESEGIWIGNL